MALLIFIHIFLYPAITGGLLVTFGINLRNGNRWVILSGPAFAIAAMLTLTTFDNYMGYLGL